MQHEIPVLRHALQTYSMMALLVINLISTTDGNRLRVLANIETDVTITLLCLLQISLPKYCDISDLWVISLSRCRSETARTGTSAPGISFLI